MFVNELSINTCSPWLLKKKKDYFGVSLLVSNSCSHRGDRQKSVGWGPSLGTGHGLQSRGGSSAFVLGGKRQIFRVCKQLLGRSQEVFGNRAASILNKAGGQVSPKNKGQTHTQGEDFLLCWHKSESVADPCLERGQIITSLLREMGSHQLLFFLLFLFSLWLLCSLDS